MKNGIMYELTLCEFSELLSKLAPMPADFEVEHVETEHIYRRLRIVGKTALKAGASCDGFMRTPYKLMPILEEEKESQGPLKESECAEGWYVMQHGTVKTIGRKRKMSGVSLWETGDYGLCNGSFVDANYDILRKIEL